MKRIIDFLTKVEIILGSVGLCASIALTFCQVVNRYWLNFEIMWISDLALYIFIFTVYVAISYGASQKTHIAVDILPEYLCGDSQTKKYAFEIFKYSVTILMVLSMAPSVWRLLKRAFRYPEYATLIRWFNTSWFVYALGAMMVLTVLHCLYHIAAAAHEMKKIAWVSGREGKGSFDV